MTSYTACIFDFDGTLADSSECAVVATQRAFLSHGLPVPGSEAIIRYMGVPIERSFPEMLSDTPHDVPHAELFQTFRRIYAEEASLSLKLFPNISDVLLSLSTRSIKIGIATSKKSSVALDNCRGLGIDGYINVVVGSDNVGNFKPHPESVLLLLTRWSCPTDSALMIGDSTYDIEMGNNAGIDTCAVLWGAHSEAELRAVEPDYLASQPLDLLEIVYTGKRHG